MRTPFSLMSYDRPGLSDNIFLQVYLFWRMFYYCVYPCLREFTAVLPLETATDEISSHSVGHEGGHRCKERHFFTRPVQKRDKSCQTVHLKKNRAITTVDTVVIIVISQQRNASILYPSLRDNRKVCQSGVYFFFFFQ